MSNERADEFLSWRGRLAPPDALPDQGLDDKEVSWERLAERLREKPRRRWIGYWVAAACLLLALIPATHFFRDRPARLAGRHAVPRPSAVPQATVPPRPTALSRSPRRQTATDQTASRRSPTTPRHNLPAQDLPLIARLDYHPAVIAEPVLPLSGDANTRMIAQPLAPRKQLRVVQINEINNSAGPAPAMTTRYPSPFHIGLGVPEMGHSDDQASQPGSASFLKIKLSSQNR